MLKNSPLYRSAQRPGDAKRRTRAKRGDAENHLLRKTSASLRLCVEKQSFFSGLPERVLGLNGHEYIPTIGNCQPGDSKLNQRQLRFKQLGIQSHCQSILATEA